MNPESIEGGGETSKLEVPESASNVGKTESVVENTKAIATLTLKLNSLSNSFSQLKDDVGGVDGLHSQIAEIKQLLK